MKRALVVAAALCGVLLASCAHAGNGTPINTGSAETLTWPCSVTGPTAPICSPRRRS